MGLTLLNQKNSTLAKAEILNTPERIAAAIAEHPAFKDVDLDAFDLVVLDVDDIFCYDKETQDPLHRQYRVDGTPQDSLDRYFEQAVNGCPVTGTKGIRIPIDVSPRFDADLHDRAFTCEQGHTRVGVATKANYKYIIGKIHEDLPTMSKIDQIDLRGTGNAHPGNGEVSTPHDIKTMLKDTLLVTSHMKKERSEIATAELALKKGEGLSPKERQELKSLIKSKESVILEDLEGRAYRWNIGSRKGAKRAAKSAYNNYKSEQIHQLASLDKEQRTSWMAIVIGHPTGEGTIYQRFLLKAGEGGFFPKLSGDISAKVRDYRKQNGGKSPKKVEVITATHGSPNTELFFKTRLGVDDFLREQNKYIWSHGLPAGKEMQIVVKYIPQIKEGKYREDMVMTYGNLKDVDYVKRCYKELTQRNEEKKESQSDISR